MRVSPGAVVAQRYRLNQFIGEGGMGRVWSGTQVLTGRAVAIKLLNVPTEDEGEARIRFMLEAQAACAVDHPNVVEIIDFADEAGEVPVLVMELLHGETLATKLGRERVLPLDATASLLMPVISAVGTAHSRGIVHRDLKPANIFLSQRGEQTVVKVLDFGIAKWLVPRPGQLGLRTRTGSMMGSPSYMAPEQAVGDRTLDCRVDIWALGVILYECLAGRRPVQCESAAELVVRLLRGGIEPIERLVRVPPELANLVGRMLSRDRRRRPADLREVLEILRGYGDLAVPEFGAPSAGEILESEANALSSKPSSTRSTSGAGETASTEATIPLEDLFHTSPSAPTGDRGLHGGDEHQPAPAESPRPAARDEKIASLLPTAAEDEVSRSTRATSRKTVRNSLFSVSIVAFLLAIMAGAMRKMLSGRGGTVADIANSAQNGSSAPGSLQSRTLTLFPADQQIVFSDITASGTNFVYALIGSQGERSTVWFGTFDGDAPRRLKQVESAGPGFASLMPDGDAVVLLRWIDRAARLRFLQNADETEASAAIGTRFVLPEESQRPDGPDSSLELVLIPLAGGQERIMTVTGFVPSRQGLTGMRVSPDGQEICVGMEGGVIAINTATGRARLITQLGAEEYVIAMAWSPDANRLAFIRQPAHSGTELEVVGADGRGRRSLLRDWRLHDRSTHGAGVVWLDDRRLVISRQNDNLEPGGGLWELDLAANAETSRAPHMIHRWERQFPAEVAVSRASKRLLVEVAGSQGDVFVGRLENGARKLSDVARMTLDDADDWPSGWLSDGRVIFTSDRFGSWNVFAQDPRGEAELLGGHLLWQRSLVLVGQRPSFWRLDSDPQSSQRVAELVRIETDGSGKEKHVLDVPREGEVGTTLPASLHAGCAAAGSGICVLGKNRGNVNSLHRFDPVGGRIDSAFYEYDGPIPSWDLSSTGFTVAVVRGDRRALTLVDTRTGSASLIPLEAGWWETVHWLPDGTALMLTGTPAIGHGHAIARVDLAGRMDLLQVSETSAYLEAIPSPDGKLLAFGAITQLRNLQVLENW